MKTGTNKKEDSQTDKTLELLKNVETSPGLASDM
jgi:hypothetical protein